MEPKQILSKYLFGLTIPQQYVCVSVEDVSNPLKIMLTSKEDDTAISVDPIFVGYKPVVFALHDTPRSLEEKEYCLNFYSHSDFLLNSKWNQSRTDKNSVARMVVQFLPSKFKTLPQLRLLKGERGQHSFISSTHRVMNSIREQFQKNRPENVSLPGNLHDMVRIAYSVPRTIALVSVGDGRKMNLFPTDLHGQIDDAFYLSSLRIGGKAQQQVEQFQKIVLCEVESGSFGSAYRLGKNHMKEMLPISNFDLLSAKSERFNLPLPKTTLRYLELTVVEFVDVGIHRIFLYRIENRDSLRPGPTLGHVHQYYAEWRKRMGMKTDFFLRRQ